MSPIYVPGKVVLAKQFTWNETVWNPSMISTALWLDAADASTVTLVSGAVSQWNDKSGNNRNATQATVGNRPTYTSAALNGKNVVAFPGTACMTANNVAITQPGNVTVFAVAQYSTGTGAQFYGVSANGVGILKSSTEIQIFRAGSAASVGQSAGNLVPVLSSAGQNGVNAFVSVNGNTPSITSSFPTSTTTNSTNAIIGALVDGSPPTLPISGYIAELLVVNTYDTSANLSKTVGYLAHKWGLEANLPVGHPYKTTGPTP